MNGDRMVAGFTSLLSLAATWDGDVIAGCALAAISMLWLHVSYSEGR